MIHAPGASDNMSSACHQDRRAIVAGDSPWVSGDHSDPRGEVRGEGINGRSFVRRDFQTIRPNGFTELERNTP